MQIAKYIKLAKGAKIRNALAHTLSIFRHHPKLTVAATGLAAVSAAIATGISAYIDEMDAGKDSSNHPAVAALHNFFPIRCRIYSNQFMMTFEDFNLEYFFSKVKQYRGIYREEICFKDTKKRTLRIHNHDEAAMATILLNSVKSQNTLKFIRC